MNSVAPSFCANVNHRIADALGLGQKNVFLARNSQRQRVHERILRVARLKTNFSANRRHAKTISVVRDSTNHTIEDAAIGFGYGGISGSRAEARHYRTVGRCRAEARHYRTVLCDRPKPQRIQHRNRPRAHRKNIAQNSADTGRRALKRFDITGMIVRFDFERRDQTVANIHHAGVFARSLYHQFPARRQSR